MMTKQTLVRLAETYAEHMHLKLSTVSTYVANDGKFFGSLKKSAGLTMERAERTIRWFDANWPADLAWPKDIQRPAKRKDAA